LPTSPIGIVIKIILSGASLEDLIPGFGPGEFITNFTHLLGYRFIGIGLSKKILGIMCHNEKNHLF
jgi:hypothetical protein